MSPFPVSRPFVLQELVQYGPGQINSRLLRERNDCYAVLYAIDAGESISDETALQSRLLHVLEGTLHVIVRDAAEPLHAGETRVVPRGTVYGLRCKEKCKFALIGLSAGGHERAGGASGIPDESAAPGIFGDTTKEEIQLDQELFIRKLPQSAVLRLEEQISYGRGQTASLTLVQRPDLGVTLFAVDEGAEIRKHVTPGDALVQVLEGAAEITIGDDLYTVRAGESIVMPAHIPHALKAVEPFKILLVVVKAPAREAQS